MMYDRKEQQSIFCNGQELLRFICKERTSWAFQWYVVCWGLSNNLLFFMPIKHAGRYGSHFGKTDLFHWMNPNTYIIFDILLLLTFSVGDHGKNKYSYFQYTDVVFKLLSW